MADYLTHRELEEIRERVKQALPVAAFLVGKLLRDRDEWVERARAEAQLRISGGHSAE